MNFGISFSDHSDLGLKSICSDEAEDKSDVAGDNDTDIKEEYRDVNDNNCNYYDNVNAKYICSCFQESSLLKSLNMKSSDNHRTESL